MNHKYSLSSRLTWCIAERQKQGGRWRQGQSCGDAAASKLPADQPVTQPASAHSRAVAVSQRSRCRVVQCHTLSACSSFPPPQHPPLKFWSSSFPSLVKLPSSTTLPFASLRLRIILVSSSPSTPPISPAAPRLVSFSCAHLISDLPLLGLLSSHHFVFGISLS